ncbi:MAG: hypothetical protein CMJ49_00835 [Planctomycetaceae bacterium]|nr:hypothetical protein [Planctomycetaceae bacterium]
MSHMFPRPMPHRSLWLIALIVLTPVIGAEPNATIDDAPLVIVTSRAPGAGGTGQGFVIGEGSFVVTALHVAADRPDGGDGHINAIVNVYSPAWGAVCEARLVAADTEADLAILATPWRGHPAYVLADSSDVLSAGRLRVVSRHTMVDALHHGQPDRLADAPRMDVVDLPVDYIAVRAGRPMGLRTGQADEVGEGWSGSPIFFRDRREVAAVATKSTRTVNRLGEEESAAIEGASADLIRDKMDAARQKQGFVSYKMGDAPAHADRAAPLMLRAFAMAKADRHPEALLILHELKLLRPESAAVHVLLANEHQDLHQVDAAEAEYRQAMKLNTNALGPRILLAQMLNDVDRRDEAVKLLRAAWDEGLPKPQLAVALINILGQEAPVDQRRAWIDAAMQVNPRNALLWMCLTQCHIGTGDAPAAGDAIATAIRLAPMKFELRIWWAEQLKKLERFDDAEQQYQQMILIQPNNPTPRYLYAEFLRERGPERVEDALTQARKAMALPDEGKPPRDVIRELIGELYSAQVDATE